MNTAQDVVDYLLTSVGGGAQDGEHKAVRQAVVHGTREVMQCRNWLWHTRTGAFTTSPLSTTASIQQGSKAVVVADPTGFVPGRIVDFSAKFFATPVKVMAVSGNVVDVDVPALMTATGVTAQPQTYYDLPPDVKDIDALTTNTVGTLHCYITPIEWQRLEINTRGAGEPYYYTIMRSDLHPDRFQIRFVGVQTPATVVNYTYRYIPKPIKYMGFERICRQGTVQLSLVDNVPTVTGTGTAFPQDVLGSVIRFGTTSEEADTIGSLSPYLAERTIRSWNSQTSLTVSGATDNTGAVNQNVPASSGYDGGVVGVAVSPPPPPTSPSNLYSSDQLELPAKTKYSLTDVIDCSPQMFTAILSAADMWYARLAGKPLESSMQLFQRDLRLAMENDVVAPMSGSAKNNRWPTPRSMGWHSDLRADVE
jgi:hypothetical protein